MRIRAVVAAALIAAVAAFTTTPAVARPAPKACTRALTNAENLVTVMSAYNDGVGAFFTTSAESAQRHAAGTYADLVAIVRDLADASSTLHGVIENAATLTTIEAAQFRRNAEKCRAAR